MNEPDRYQESNDIAIIGLAGRFPGARDAREFWQNLKDGVESISFFAAEELEPSPWGTAPVDDPHFVKAGGVLDGVDQFDAAFFGFNPREAATIDPQHRLFLESSWEALERAGYDPERYPGLIGVYAGSSLNTYLFNVLSGLGAAGPADHYQAMIGNDKDFLATRVGYKLNLTGPCVTIQTACSTSLVAVHMACQGLLSYQCDMALAGGVSIRLPQRAGYLYQPGSIASPDGHCRAFDQGAQGTVSGNGVGVVVLKRLADAVADGDHIHAVIKGSAINNDGSLKVGFTAPSVEQQARVIASAQLVAEVDPESITYVEAHGTGTPLGDPIEIAALTRAFRAGTQARDFCAIGSVKTNIGHLDAAAGVAGLIKTALALEHRLIPPSLHFTAPNPQIDFANSPFYVNAALTEWQSADGSPRRAGVSSFGIGGTNAHLVLEEAPPLPAADGADRPWQVLLLSARTGPALEAATARLREHLAREPGLRLADVAYTTQAGRRAFPHRRVLLCRDQGDALDSLEAMDPQRVYTGARQAGGCPVVFLFPGQGAQYVNMTRELYETEPLFRREVDTCCDLLRPHLATDLRDLLYPAPEQAEEARCLLNQTEMTQPALFVAEYALARLWMAWGIRPQAMIGHSIGEYVAACLAGVFTLPDALRLVAARGRLMQEQPPGAMLAIPLPEEEVRSLLEGDLSLAAVNGPALCVVAGPLPAIERAERLLSQRGLNGRRLHTSHAFHSAMMDPVLPRFSQLLEVVPLNRPAIPFISNLTGSWITPEDATDPAYWATHLRQTVRFADGVRELLREPDHLLLEVGPGETLSRLAGLCPEAGGRVILSSLGTRRDEQGDLLPLLTALGRLWLAGAEVDWAKLHEGRRRRRLPLPTYPFERRRHWIDPQALLMPGSPQVPPRKRPGIADWLYLPSWRRTLAPVLREPERAGTWLALTGPDGPGSALAERLAQLGHDLVTVMPGERFERLGEGSYAINPADPDDYQALLRELRSREKVPGFIAHLWLLTPRDRHASPERVQDLGFYSLVHLAQALGRQHVTTPVRIGMVASHLCAITAGEPVDWAKASALGPCRVIPQEYPNIACRAIDLTGGELNGRQIDRLIAEFLLHAPEQTVAYRGAQRWVRAFEPLDHPAEPTGGPGLRPQGVYLITGGLGGIGLILAEHLARTVQARLVLVGRSGLPERDRWADWLAEHDHGNPTSLRIRKVQELEALGAQVLVGAADVADEAQMRSVVAAARGRFGPIHGLFHAAGVVGPGAFRPIADLQRADCERHFRPKVHGLLTLERVLQGENLDFCLLFSSLSSMLGGLGHAAYSAANQAMDALAQARTGWLTANWDAWQTDLEEGQALASDPDEMVILPAEGMATVERLLALGPVDQVVVSTGDLEARMAVWTEMKQPFEAAAEAASPQALHPRPRLQTAYVPPRDPLEERLALLWQQVLGIEPVGVQDDFFALGGHSLLALQLAARIQTEFGRNISLASLLQEPTVELLARMLQAEAEPAAGSLLVPIQPAGSRRPLFLVHPAGGSVLKYLDLARHLGAEQPVYGLQAQGLDLTKEPHRRIEEMAAAYLAALHSLQPEGPYQIGGWSMGGVIAYEMARHLHARGQEVSLLALIDSFGVPPQVEQGDDAAILAALFAYDFPVTAADLRRLSPDEQLTFIIEQARRANMVPPGMAIGLDQARHLLGVWKAHAEASLAYRPGEYGGPVILFRAGEQPEYLQDPKLHWGRHATGPIAVHDIPGNHYTIVREPGVRLVAEALSARLRRVDQ